MSPDLNAIEHFEKFKTFPGISSVWIGAVTWAGKNSPGWLYIFKRESEKKGIQGGKGKWLKQVLGNMTGSLKEGKWEN